MMFPNSNSSIVKRLTIRSLQQNRFRNRFVWLAIVLTAFLVTSVFSIGMSYVKTIDRQQLKMMGTNSHAALTLPREDQIDKLRKLDYVDEAGLSASVAHVVNTPEMGHISVNLHWYDKTEWEKMRKPLVDSFTGTYPQKANEILVPTWILEKMGIRNPQLGMPIELAFRTIRGTDLSEERQSGFVLSGWYSETMHIRSGNIGSMFVSAPFAESLGAYPWTTGSASIVFGSEKRISTLAERLERDIGLTGDQKVKVVPLYERETEGGLAMGTGFAGMIGFILFSGYLLIYNVLYISVSKDTRFYGLLKTIGMTPRQIRTIVTGQARRLAWTGIPAGMALGAVTSFAAVPLALGSLDVEAGVEVSFSPVIFIGTALFTWLTTMASSMKPAATAGSISPIEAVKYTGLTMKTKVKKSTGGSKLHRMALRNVFRDKKRAAVVFLSLFLGLTTFLTVNSLVLSMDTDHFLASYTDNDFDLYNNTMRIGYPDEVKSVITEDKLKDIQSIEGIRQIRTTYMSKLEIRYDPVVFGKHIDAFVQKTKSERPSDEAIIQNDLFRSLLIGLDTEYVREMNQKLEKPIDIGGFERGEVALIGGSPENYETGSPVQLRLPGNNAERTVQIGGFVDWMFQAPYGSLAPNVYVSHRAFEQMVADPLIYKLNIQADPAKHPQIADRLKAIINGDRAWYMESRMEQAEDLKAGKQMLYILGGGITVILAFIGILNFMNTMLTGITVRQQELTVMESIGMSKKQLRTILLYEGVWYAVLTALLLSTLGTLISYGAYRLFRIEATYAVYTFPFVPLLVSLILVFAVCLVVPLVFYRILKTKTIVERLREAA